MNRSTNIADPSNSDLLHQISSDAAVVLAVCRLKSVDCGVEIWSDDGWAIVAKRSSVGALWLDGFSRYTVRDLHLNVDTHMYSRHAATFASQRDSLRRQISLSTRTFSCRFSQDSVEEWIQESILEAELRNRILARKNKKPVEYELLSIVNSDVVGNVSDIVAKISAGLQFHSVYHYRLLDESVTFQARIRPRILRPAEHMPF